MAHNTRVRDDLTAWGTGAVTDEEFDELDAGQFKSINADDGGTWAPVEPIEIGGAGFIINGPLAVGGDAAFTGEVTFDNNPVSFLSGADVEFFDTATFHDEVSFEQDAAFGAGAPVSFAATATFNGALVANGDITLGSSAADTMTVNAITTFAQDCAFQDPVVFSDDVEFNNNINFTGAQIEFGNGTELHFGTSTTITGTQTFTGSPTLGARLRYTGSGRVGLRITELDNTSQTVTVEDGNVFVQFPSGSAKTVTLDPTGEVAGYDFAIFHNGDAAVSPANLIVEYPFGGATDQITVTPGKTRMLIRRETSSNWIPLDFT